MKDFINKKGVLGIAMSGIFCPIVCKIISRTYGSFVSWLSLATKKNPTLK